MCNDHDLLKSTRIGWESTKMSRAVPTLHLSVNYIAVARACNGSASTTRREKSTLSKQRTNSYRSFPFLAMSFTPSSWVFCQFLLPIILCYLLCSAHVHDYAIDPWCGIKYTYCTPEISNKDVIIIQYQIMLPIFLQCTWSE